MRRQRGRVARAGTARRSEALEKGGGDPRQRRSEAQRLTDKDLDPAALKIENGRVTLVREKAEPVARAALSDYSAGTPSTAVPAIPDPAVPATAAALQADLVANALPALRNALATLAATMNALLAQAGK